MDGREHDNKPVKVCQNARAKICYKIEARAVAIWVAAFFYIETSTNKQTNRNEVRE